MAISLREKLHVGSWRRRAKNRCQRHLGATALAWGQRINMLARLCFRTALTQDNPSVRCKPRMELPCFFSVEREEHIHRYVIILTRPNAWRRSRAPRDRKPEHRVIIGHNDGSRVGRARRRPHVRTLQQIHIKSLFEKVRLLAHGDVVRDLQRIARALRDSRKHLASEKISTRRSIEPASFGNRRGPIAGRKCGNEPIRC